MLINLSDILSADDKSMSIEATLDLNEFQSRLGIFPIIKKNSVALTVTHVKDREFLVKGNTKITVAIPCDRCLQDVATELDIVFDKECNMNVSEEKIEEIEEQNYIDGYNLDVDKLLYNEILIGWPMKILCSNDCKGICNVCGQNLNEGTCNCEDTSLDPRMSVIRDVFKNFKEV